MYFNYQKKIITFSLILLVGIQSTVFGVWKSDAYTTYNFQPQTEVVAEKISITANTDYLDPPEGDVIGFKVGTLEIAFKGYNYIPYYYGSYNYQQIKKTRINLVDYQNYTATIKSTKKDPITNEIQTAESTMTLVCKADISLYYGAGESEWHKIDKADAGSHAQYCEIGDFNNFQSANIAFYFIIDDPDVLINDSNVEITVTHHYNEQAVSGNNPAIFMFYYYKNNYNSNSSNYNYQNWFDDTTGEDFWNNDYYSFYQDDRTIDQSTTLLTIEKDFVKHYVEENSQLTIQVSKLYEEEYNNEFFNGDLTNFYKIKFASTIQNRPTTHSFEIGLQIASRNNFKLYKMNGNNSLNSNKSIPYEVFLKTTNGHCCKILNNTNKYVLTNINKNQAVSNNTLYISTKCSVNDKTLPGGNYIDYLYLNFYTDDYNTTSSSIIDLSN